MRKKAGRASHRKLLSRTKPKRDRLRALRRRSSRGARRGFRFRGGAARDSHRPQGPVLVVEIDEGSLQALGTSAAQLIDSIAGLGYIFALLTRRGVEPPSVTELRFHIAKEPERYLDVVCRPDDAAVEPPASHGIA
jgi:hypothetical protein